MKQYVYYVVFETYEGNRSDKIVSLTEKISSDRSINDLKSAVMEGTYGSLNVILHNFYLLRVEGEEDCCRICGANLEPGDDGMLLHPVRGNSCPASMEEAYHEDWFPKNRR